MGGGGSQEIAPVSDNSFESQAKNVNNLEEETPFKKLDTEEEYKHSESYNNGQLQEYHNADSENNYYESNGDFDQDTAVVPEMDETLKLMFEFLPYYGSNDPSTDLMIRRTLKSLSSHDVEVRDEYHNTLLLLAVQVRRKKNLQMFVFL